MTPKSCSNHYGFGAVLPDLVRIFNRDNRVRPLNKTFRDPVVQDINEGVAWHFRVDKWFHKTRFFEEQTDFIKKHLARQQFEDPPRFLFFIAHILLELLLDRLLIKEDSENGRSFYICLDKIPEKDIISYLKSQRNVNYIRDFVRVFKRFRADQYVFDYQDNERFIFALNRTVQRTGNKGFQEKDIPKLIKSIAIIEERLYSQDFKKIFNNLEPRDYVDLT